MTQDLEKVREELKPCPLDLDALEKVAREAAQWFGPGPWRNEHPKSWIWGTSLKGGDTHVADVRGWGYLTGGGHGALGLSQEEGSRAQDQIGDHIALFHPATVLALIAAARRAPIPSVEGEVEAAGVLRRLEEACDAVAGGRTRETYLAMIADGQEDALLALDEARRAARDILSRSPGEDFSARAVSRQTQEGSAQPLALQETLTDWQDRALAAEAESERLSGLLNTPELHDFTRAVVLEAAHQRERWGSSHDAGKAPQDWFWLLGWLAGKAVHAAGNGDTDKALHHCVSSAAALANWHAALSGESTAMRPGINPEERGYSAPTHPLHGPIGDGEVLS